MWNKKLETLSFGSDLLLKDYRILQYQLQMFIGGLLIRFPEIKDCPEFFRDLDKMEEIMTDVGNDAKIVQEEVALILSDLTENKKVDTTTGCKILKFPSQ